MNIKKLSLEDTVGYLADRFNVPGGLDLDGIVPTVEDIPTPLTAKTLYAVGTEAPFEYYYITPELEIVSLGDFMGPEGLTGATGPRGPKGDDGQNGARGPQGYPGPKGDGVQTLTHIEINTDGSAGTEYVNKKYNVYGLGNIRIGGENKQIYTGLSFPIEGGDGITVSMNDDESSLKISSITKSYSLTGTSGNITSDLLNELVSNFENNILHAISVSNCFYIALGYDSYALYYKFSDSMQTYPNNQKILRISRSTRDWNIADYNLDYKYVQLEKNSAQTVTRTDGDTPIYLKGDDNDATYLGFKRRSGTDLGFIGVEKYMGPIFYSDGIGRDVPLMLSENIKSSRIYNNYSRKIFKGSFGFLPDIGSDGTATFTFNGIEGHSPSGTVSSKTIESHRLTAWFCTKAGKTGADGDSNYYKLVILQMPASLLDLSAIGSRTFMIPKNNDVLLTITGISSAKSISYVAEETWANTQTGE